eukprot:SAG22_NODE_2931_length_2096_cov_1.806710_5_plen_71_part_00
MAIMPHAVASFCLYVGEMESGGGWTGPRRWQARWERAAVWTKYLAAYYRAFTTNGDYFSIEDQRIFAFYS